MSTLSVETPAVAPAREPEATEPARKTLLALAVEISRYGKTRKDNYWKLKSDSDMQQGFRFQLRVESAKGDIVSQICPRCLSLAHCSCPGVPHEERNTIMQSVSSFAVAAVECTGFCELGCVGNVELHPQTLRDMNIAKRYVQKEMRKTGKGTVLKHRVSPYTIKSGSEVIVGIHYHLVVRFVTLGFHRFDFDINNPLQAEVVSVPLVSNVVPVSATLAIAPKVNARPGNTFKTMLGPGFICTNCTKTTYIPFDRAQKKSSNLKAMEDLDSSTTTTTTTTTTTAPTNPNTNSTSSSSSSSFSSPQSADHDNEHDNEHTHDLTDGGHQRPHSMYVVQPNEQTQRPSQPSYKEQSRFTVTTINEPPAVEKRLVPIAPSIAMEQLPISMSGYSHVLMPKPSHSPSSSSSIHLGKTPSMSFKPSPPHKSSRTSLSHVEVSREESSPRDAIDSLISLQRLSSSSSSSSSSRPSLPSSGSFPFVSSSFSPNPQDPTNFTVSRRNSVTESPSLSSAHSVPKVSSDSSIARGKPKHHFHVRSSSSRTNINILNDDDEDEHEDTPASEEDSNESPFVPTTSSSSNNNNNNNSNSSRHPQQQKVFGFRSQHTSEGPVFQTQTRNESTPHVPMAVEDDYDHNDSDHNSNGNCLDDLAGFTRSLPFHSPSGSLTFSKAPHFSSHEMGSTPNQSPSSKSSGEYKFGTGSGARETTLRRPFDRRTPNTDCTVPESLTISSSASASTNSGSTCNSRLQSLELLQLHQRYSSLTTQITPTEEKTLLDANRQIFGPLSEGVALTLHFLGFVNKNNRNLDRAIFYLCEALDVFQDLHGPNSKEAADILNNLAILFQRTDQHDRALEYYHKALEMCQVLFGDRSKEVATILNNMALVSQDRGQLDLALEFYRRALSIHRLTSSESGPKEDIAITLSNVAFILRLKGQKETALDNYQQALAVYQRIPDKEAETIGVLNIMASLCKETKQFDNALKHLQFGLEISKRVFGENSKEIATLLNSMGILYQEMHETSLAYSYYQNSIDITRSLFGDNSCEVAMILKNVASVAKDCDDYRRSLTLYQRVLEIFKQHLGENHQEVAATLRNIAIIYRIKKDYPLASLFYERTLAISRNLFGEYHQDVAEILNDLGVVYHKQKDYILSVEHLVRALNTYKIIFGECVVEVAVILNNLAIILKEKKDYAGALSNFEQALRIYVRLFGEECKEVASITKNMAIVLKERQEPSQALAFFQRALGLTARTSGEKSMEVADILTRIATIFIEQGSQHQAVEYYNQSLAIFQHNRDPLESSAKPHPDPTSISSLIPLTSSLIPSGIVSFR